VKGQQLIQQSITLSIDDIITLLAADVIISDSQIVAAQMILNVSQNK
jgi:hypothetical protein